jgi:hypothetical protein
MKRDFTMGMHREHLGPIIGHTTNGLPIRAYYEERVPQPIDEDGYPVVQIDMAAIELRAFADEATKGINGADNQSSAGTL